MSSQSEDAIFRAFASCIFKDVQRYVLEHQDEYQKYLDEQAQHNGVKSETEFDSDS